MTYTSTAVTMEKLVSLCKRRGFVFPGSEIYGGLANAWDYGPLGVTLKRRIKDLWWQRFVDGRDDVVGLDSAILMNPAVWEASGHLAGFSDPLVDCRACKTRHRADKLIERHLQKQGRDPLETVSLSDVALHGYLVDQEVTCPDCGACNWTDLRQFNLMFKTFLGVTEDRAATVYLRPETAQGIFVNFKQVQTACRQRVPFGIGQIGKSFRNEITPGNFIFRTREFEQMELEFFCHAKEAASWLEHWKGFCWKWLIDTLGLCQKSLRIREHGAEELSHYSQATLDIEYHFPFGWGELWGLAHRGNFDLQQHETHSGKILAYIDTQNGERYLPHVIEPALGVDRLLLAILADAYREESVEGTLRIVLGLEPQIAPWQAAVLPLSRKLAESAKKLKADLHHRHALRCDYDESGSIGKRYRRHDEIGTPFCITIDFDTDTDASATIRERDSMNQTRMPLERIPDYMRQAYAIESNFSPKDRIK